MITVTMGTLYQYNNLLWHYMQLCLLMLPLPQLISPPPVTAKQPEIPTIIASQIPLYLQYPLKERRGPVMSI